MGLADLTKYRVDILVLTACALMVLLYHWRSRVAARRHDSSLVHEVMKQARRRWVTAIMSERGTEVLAVQTMRNSVMAASFMASTSALLMMGMLTVGPRIEAGVDGWIAESSGSSLLDSVKILALAIDFFIAFLMFAMSVRFFNHVGYLINDRSLPGDEGPRRVTEWLNRAGVFYTAGVRFFFGSLPLGLWLIGPWCMFVATIVLLLLFWKLLDHGPVPNMH
ncbi:MAG: DUF599 domain-containing protein [Burkholderiaceae bacterium]